MINHLNPSIVLAKALFRAAAQLGLKEIELADAIGISRKELTSLENSMTLDPESNAGELALHVIRIAQSLYNLEGGNESGIKEFMRNENRITCGVLANQMRQTDELRTIVERLEGICDQSFS